MLFSCQESRHLVVPLIEREEDAFQTAPEQICLPDSECISLSHLHLLSKDKGQRGREKLLTLSLSQGVH